MSPTSTPSCINTDAPGPTFPKSFDLTCPKGTDVYAAPHHGYIWTSPVIYYSLPNYSTFKSARVSVAFNWIHTFDQAGLILVYPSSNNPRPDASNADTKDVHPRWVKAGVEVEEGKPQISVVGRDGGWADWSLSTFPPTAGAAGNSVSATIEFERSDNSLKVFVHEGETKTMVREIQWVFDEPEKEKPLWIGVYAARPDPLKDAKGGLEVKFREFEVLVE
jgi:uncharacterized protein